MLLRLAICWAVGLRQFSRMGVKRFITVVCGLIVGANWTNGAASGPFARNLNNAPSNRNANISARGALNQEGQMCSCYGSCSGAELNGLCIQSLGLEYGWVAFASSAIERKGGCYA